MLYCNHCKTEIRGNKKRCPLCSNILPDDGSYEEEIFPDIPPIYERHLAVRIMIFISVVSIVASFSLNIIFPSDNNWPMFVLLGLLSMWTGLIIVLQKRHNITKNIMWLVAIISILSVIWDWRIGWKGWSLDYVIPIVSVAAMFVMYVTAKITKLGVREYILYFLLDGLFGIIPVLFVLLNWLNVIAPSVICVSISIIFISAIMIFQGENIIVELNKRMHI